MAIKELLEESSRFNIKNERNDVYFEEVKKKREEFLQKFPLNELKNLTLEKYVVGKGDKETFCYWLEFGLKNLIFYIPGPAEKFGIYYSKGKYFSGRGRSKKMLSEEESRKTFENIKDEIIKVCDFFRKESLDLSEIENLSLQHNVIQKILCLYLPDKFISTAKKEVLWQLSRDLPLKNRNNLILLNFECRKELYKYSEFKNWNGDQLGVFFWNYYEKSNETTDEHEPVTQNESDLPTADEYLLAFIKFFEKSGIDSENQKKMLKFHLNQKNYSTTSRIITENMGLTNIGHTNIVYGKLAKGLCQILGKKGYRWAIQILFDLRRTDDFNKELQWVMHQSVVEALNKFFSMSEEEKTEFVNNFRSIEPKTQNKNKNSPLNLILYGPPGTGKTYNTTAFAVRLIEGGDPFKIMTNLKDNNLSDIEIKKFSELRKSGQIEFITFHQSYSYEDFVEGIKPDVEKEEMRFKRVDGIFKNICIEADKNHDKTFVLIIDEINRGNISRIFGELITLIEEDKRDGKLTVKLPYSQEDFTVPSNLFIIGTMNTADRSIALLDIALRRRFTFFRFDPRPELVENTKAKEIMTKLNEKIKEYKGADFQIGHSYFMKVTNDEELETVLKYKINPLLEEYFVNDSKKIEDLKKIGG